MLFFLRGKEMNNEEYLEFLKSLLIKIENVVNLLEQKPSRHIPAYNKMLGVRQKFSNIGDEYKNSLFPHLVGVKSIIHYLMNGRYDDAYHRVIKLKSDLVKIYISLKKET